MFFNLVQRVNALLWLTFGLVMAFAGDLLNILFATQYPWLTAPFGWLLLAYTGWLLLMGGRAAKMARPLKVLVTVNYCLLYTSPSPRDVEESRMPSSA